MTELDKFKRRTIRCVARLLFKEKRPSEELWAEMKKETGTDCRILWERMRALCVKKLNRLLAVDDRSAHLPSIARLSLTDWLLVDLVLVHEKIDVIGVDKSGGKEAPALLELFNLVQSFDVEGRSGDSLATSWAAATVFYNRQGRQCSPMLLQRRWYQLKKLTRCRFYKFWFSYKGNYRLLEEARKSMPTRLQMAIAKRYPKVITGEFPEWEDQIQKGFVIMPEEFETKMRMPNLPKPCNSNDPDLVLVEPEIETIDLRIDSDPEDHNDDNVDDASDPEISNDATDVTNPNVKEPRLLNNEALGIKIKTEPVEEDGLSNVQVISATHVPEVEIPDDSPEDSPGPEPQKDSEVDRESRVGNSPEDEDDILEIPSMIPSIDVELELPTYKVEETVPTKELPEEVSPSSDVVTLNDSDEGVDDIIKVKADEFCRKVEEAPSEKSVSNTIDDLIKDKVDIFLKTPKEDILFSDKKLDSSNVDLTKNKTVEVTAIDLMADLNFNDDGIEFVDDGVEFVEEDDEQKIESASETSPGDENNDNFEENAPNKFDLKLLMDPVVYTTKLDQMKIFTYKQFHTVDNKEDIEMAALESKPVSKKSFNINVKQESVTSFNDAGNDAGDDDFISDSQDDMDEEPIPIVSHTSYMLRKPRTRTYDPFKLCKNPDFNTKLRRLTIGFLSSARNRQLLSACIPMTIDLSKAFESKLVDNTLYLKSSGVAPIVKEEVKDNQASSMAPLAMPVQSLIDNSKTDIRNLILPATESIVSERKKVINLPDIDKVRRINQQLLTAQVPPLRVYTGHQPRTPTGPVAEKVRKEEEMRKEPTPEVQPEPSEPVAMSTIISTESISNTVPAIIKDENEKANQKSLPEDIPETLPPAKEKLLKIINQAKISTQEALAKIDISTKSDFPKPIVVKKVVTPLPQDVQKRYTPPARVALAWAPRYAQPNIDIFNDFLLTNDTLNKMLHLMMSGDKDAKGCQCCSVKPKKVKGKRKRKSEEGNQKMPEKSEQKDNSEPHQKDGASVTVTSAPINIDDSPPEITVTKPVLAPGRVVQYCCWANQKLCNRRRITKHTCPPDDCQCCCRDQLAAKLLETGEKRKRGRPGKFPTVTNVMDSVMKDAIESSIENVVQQSREIVRDDSSSTVTPEVLQAVSMIIPGIDVDSPPGSQSPKKVHVSVDLSPMPILRALPTPPKPPFVVTKIRAAPDSRLEPRFPYPQPLRLQQQHSLQRSKLVQSQQPRPRLVQPSQKSWVPCSCQSPAVSLSSQRNIVIDGSKNCPLHPTPIAPKQDKVLYLNSKSIAKSPSESPIFLGKNNILLTTVKFPRRNDEVVEPEFCQPPKVIPTLPLPSGVQLVLLPSGDVTYTLDPGVELDAAQLATLPTIIAAVQQQLSEGAVPDTPSVDPPIDAHPLIDTPQPDTNILENTVSPQNEAGKVSDTTGLQDTEVNVTTETTDPPPPVNLETDEVFQDAELPMKATDNINMEVDAAEGMNIDTSAEQPATSATEQVTTPTETNNVTIDPETLKDNTEAPVPDQVPSVDESEVVQTVTQSQPLVDSPTKEPGATNSSNEANDSEGINNRKSLLSDLMEMSGISAEDATAAPEPPTPAPPVEKLTDIANMMVQDKYRNLPELSPVTSFAELKYACEQNGKFFKLDFGTGVIVPINVCIKKNTRQKAPSKPKEFIDLTDDIDDDKPSSQQLEETPPTNSLLKSPVNQYLYKGKMLSVSSTVKPVKLFKAFHPPTSVIKRQIIPKVSDSPLLTKQTHLEKRKQNLNKIEAKIDLVDSDEPMEEEYLMDSSDDDSDTSRNIIEPIMYIEALDPELYESDDSSDDEPLAKKSKRLKDDIATEDDVRPTNIYDEIPDETPVLEPEKMLSVRKDLGAAIETSPADSESAPKKSSQDSSTNGIDLIPSDSAQVLDPIGSEDQPFGDDLDKTQPEFMSVSDGEAEEDCILGF